MHDEPEDTDAITIELREGMTIQMVVHPLWNTRMALLQAWSCSVLLQGKPVCLKNMLPGVTLHISTRLELHSGLIDFMRGVWPSVAPQLDEWLQATPQPDYLSLSLPYSQAWLARKDQLLPPAALHIEWLHPAFESCSAKE